MDMKTLESHVLRKRACVVRRGAGGKGLPTQYLACGLPDFVVFHPTEEGVKKAQTVLETWLTDIGLELKPSKTKITHTLREYQGTRGFDFLGWTIRQFPVGKTHTGKAN